MKANWLIGLVLFISLMVNVTMGFMWLGKSQTTVASSDQAQSVRGLIKNLDALPPEKREAARQRVKQHRKDLRQQLERIRDARREIVAYTASPQYERATAETKFEALRQLTVSLQQTSQMLLLDIADDLSSEERVTWLLKNKTENLGDAP